MYLTIRGLVLRVSNYNDADALLTVLTPNYGKITVKARGLRRKNSPLAAPCQLLAYNEFTLFEYRGMYTVNEAHCLELFSELQKDIVKLSLATYFAQVADVISAEDLPNPELLSLVLNCLYALSKLDALQQKVKAVFELRSACIAGYMPDLSGCRGCGQGIADYFDISAGQLECSACRNSFIDGIRMPINTGALEAMRYICSCDSKLLFAFSVGEASLKYLSDVAESFLVTQLERGFSTLDFYKTLLISS